MGRIFIRQLSHSEAKIIRRELRYRRGKAMATRNTTVDLADWTLLSTLIAAQDINLSKLTNCQKLDIISPSSNADGTLVQITSDPVHHDIAYSLLKEESQSFESPLRSNNISTID